MKTESDSEKTDRSVADGCSQSAPDKENIPEKETVSRSPSPKRDEFIGSILNAANRLRVRPRHVRRPSDSFDDKVLSKIQEE